MTDDTKQTDEAMQTVAAWAGARPAREVLAAMAMIQDAGVNYKSTRVYLDTIKQPSANPTLDQKWEWAFVFADNCIRYSKEHPPK